jgi:hypothetical protein
MLLSNPIGQSDSIEGVYHGRRALPHTGHLDRPVFEATLILKHICAALHFSHERGFVTMMSGRQVLSLL